MTFCDAVGDVRFDPVVGSEAADGNDVKRAVGSPSSVPVETMEHSLLGWRRDGADAAECCEAGFGFEPLGIVASRQE